MLEIENDIPESRKSTPGEEKYSSCNNIVNKEAKDSKKNREGSLGLEAVAEVATYCYNQIG